MFHYARNHQPRELIDLVTLTLDVAGCAIRYV